MNAVNVIWFQFLTCATLIGVAGYQLLRYGDVIAQRKSACRAVGWGLALLATVTSLPELATGISSVTVAKALNLAVGDALGSCVVNLVFLVVIDAFFFRKEALWPRAGQGHVLAAAFGVLMLGFTLVSLLADEPGETDTEFGADKRCHALGLWFGHAGLIGFVSGGHAHRLCL